MSAIAETLSKIDLRSTPRVPLARLVRVELRKMADTRAGMWLLAGLCAVSAAVVVIVFLNSDPADRTFTRFMTAVAIPQQFLLPVLGILLVTSEWTQRTALVTFTLEPERKRVVGAKVVAALLFGFAAVTLAMLVAAAATALGGSEVAWANADAGHIARFGLLQASSILQGLAFGLVFLNSAGAIATFFVLPSALVILSSFWKTLADAAPWVLVDTANGPLIEAGNMTGQEWAQLGVASFIWIGLPAIAGLFQVLRREVK